MRTMKSIALSLLALLVVADLAWAGDYYTHGSFPAPGSPATSAAMRAELDLISAGFDKLPSLSGNANKAVIVNGSATALGVTTGTLSLAGNFAISGAFATTLTVTGSTNVTLPTTGTLATVAGAETLTSKTVNLTSNTLTGTVAQFNASLSDGDFATLAGAETLTNKTLTSPVISTISNTGTLTLPTSTDTLVGRATTDTLTNKSLTNPTLTSPTLNGTVSGSAVLAPANGGSGSTSVPTNGQLLIGNGTNYTTATLTNGGGVGITNTPGAITLRALPRGYLWGCTLSNNGVDAVNDIDMDASCEAVSSDAALTSRVLLAPASGLTKRLDATWVAGTNQGGRSSSQALANGTWHVCLMRVAGVDDLGFDTSATCANLIVDHGATNVRRIGSILRESAAIVGFVQDGDQFQRKATVQDVNAVNPGTLAVTRTLSVPTGINVVSQFNAVVQNGGTLNVHAYFSDLAVTDAAPPVDGGAAPGLSLFGVATGKFLGASRNAIRTNTSAQIRSRLSESNGNTVLIINTLGWIDTRGRAN